MPESIRGSAASSRACALIVPHPILFVHAHLNDARLVMCPKICMRWMPCRVLVADGSLLAGAGCDGAKRRKVTVAIMYAHTHSSFYDAPISQPMTFAFVSHAHAHLSRLNTPLNGAAAHLKGWSFHLASSACGVRRCCVATLPRHTTPSPHSPRKTQSHWFLPVRCAHRQPIHLSQMSISHATTAFDRCSRRVSRIVCASCHHRGRWQGKGHYSLLRGSGEFSGREPSSGSCNL